MNETWRVSNMTEATKIRVEFFYLNNIRNQMNLHVYVIRHIRCKPHNEGVWKIIQW